MKATGAFLVVALFAATAIGEDRLAWPQFRGPDGSGVADDQQPPIEFGPDKNLKWKIAVPGGLSSPVIVGNLLVITAFEEGKLLTIAYDRANGKEKWRAHAPAKELELYHKTEGSPAASSAATDGKRIVVYFGSCGLFAYDLAGKELWKHEMPPAAVPGDFGSGVSPIIADGLVILVRDEMKDAKILALDVATGSLRWEQKRQSVASYCTPVVWRTPAGKQIAAAGHARMVGYDLKQGTEKWSVAGVPSGCCASPVVGDGTLYFAGWSPGGTGDEEFQMPKFDGLLQNLDKDKDGSLSRAEGEQAFQGFFDSQDANKDGQVTREEYETILKFMAEGNSSAFALKSGGSGDLTKTHVVWKQTKGLPYVASAILYRGQYVMVKDGGIVTAYDATSGKEIYQKRAAASGKYYASPVAANGQIYFTSLDGAVTVLEAGKPEPVVSAKNAPLEERTAATPAIADNTLYLRTEKHLYAFGKEQ